MDGEPQTTMGREEREDKDQRQEERRLPPRWVVWFRGALSLLAVVCLLACVALGALMFLTDMLAEGALGAYVGLAVGGVFLVVVGGPALIIYPGLRRGSRVAGWLAVVHDGFVVLCVLAFLGWSAVGIRQGQYESIPWDIAALVFAAPFVVEAIVLWRWVRGTAWG